MNVRNQELATRRSHVDMIHIFPTLLKKKDAKPVCFAGT
jgi:hypothetical protein